MEKVRINSSAEYLDGFLSEEECKNFIALAEDKGFEDSKIISGGREIVAKEIRNNTRVFIDDVEIASKIWLRLKPQLSVIVSGWSPVGLNERLRFYRYEPNQMFRLHRDMAYEFRNQKSFLSIIIYLNDDFEGGDTEFKDFSITPKTGRAAIFKHELLHQGNAVQAGVKYAVRTDVMFCQNV